MAKIGIMGGTFDPVHTGHLIVAQCALTQLKLDKIWFMPAGDPPHKGDEVTCAAARCDMITAAIGDNPDFELFTYEVAKERPSYSAVTMTELDALYPDTEFFFIMGADSLLYFDRWYMPKVICDHATLVVANRGDVSQDELIAVQKSLVERHGARICFIDTPRIDISSTKIRAEAVSDMRNIRYKVPERVYEYIAIHGLYQ